MTERTGRPWLNYLLGLLCVGAIVAAILLVGPASGSTTAVTRTAKAAEGVVQSTVSGSGNLQPASQLNLGFKTSGTVTKIYVSQGEYVTEGKLIAELNPQSAEVTLEQSKAALLSAEANLAKEEETDGEGSTGSGGSSLRRRECGGRIGSPNRRRKGVGIGAEHCAERYFDRIDPHDHWAKHRSRRTNPHDHRQDHRAQAQTGRIELERFFLQGKLRLIEQSHHQHRDTRSEPRLGQSCRQERPADGAER